MFYSSDYDGCWIVKSEVSNLEPHIDVVFSAVEAQESLQCSVADFVEVRDGEFSLKVLQRCHSSATWCITANASIYIDVVFTY